jgi:hypothetical protein
MGLGEMGRNRSSSGDLALLTLFLAHFLKAVKKNLIDWVAAPWFNSFYLYYLRNT